MGDVNREAVRSLKAIDAWVGIIENNIEGSQRTAFKASRPKFTDNSVKLMNTPMNMLERTGRIRPTDYIPIPSAALDIAEIKGDQKQGEIIGSTEEQHLAILGDGYFVAVQRGPKTVPAEAAMVIDYHENQFFFTRDGQFHFDADGFLRTANGLYVVSRDFPPYEPEQQALAAAINAGTRSIEDFFVSKTRQAIAVPPNFQRGPDIDPSTANMLDVNRIQLAQFPCNFGLEFSKFGTTYYNEAPASGRPEFFTADMAGRGAEIKLYSLETSNTALTEWIPVLASSAKMFSAISKIIAVYNSTVDDMNNTIR